MTYIKVQSCTAWSQRGIQIFGTFNNWSKCYEILQTKIMNIHYEKLVMQEYFLSGDRTINISKFIFKARGNTLDIKMQKTWKYSDKLCSGCGVNLGKKS